MATSFAQSEELRLWPPQRQKGEVLGDGFAFVSFREQGQRRKNSAGSKLRMGGVPDVDGRGGLADARAEVWSEGDVEQTRRVRVRRWLEAEQLA